MYTAWCTMPHICNQCSPAVDLVAMCSLPCGVALRRFRAVSTLHPQGPEWQPSRKFAGDTVVCLESVSIHRSSRIFGLLSQLASDHFLIPAVKGQELADHKFGCCSTIFSPPLSSIFPDPHLYFFSTISIVGQFEIFYLEICSSQNPNFFWLTIGY